MRRVSLVGTIHEEIGPANDFELHAILERIRPEVIFLEVPVVALDDYYVTCSQRNLESIAVRRFRQDHQVRLVPVDLPTPTREFFESTESLRMTMRAESPEYRRLMTWDRNCITRYGFAYLNSEYCSKLWSDVYQEMQSTITRLGSAGLVEVFELWKETNDLREKGMMKNIEEHCRSDVFDKGTFLVGASHRQPIIDKSRQPPFVDSASVQWEFLGPGWFNDGQ
jgi:hypothetical protein